MQTAYLIPTHRDASRAIVGYAPELAWALEQGRQVPLVVAETNDTYEASNSLALKAARRRLGDLETLHATTAVQRHFFAALLTGALKRWQLTFTTPSRDYGTAMNKLFLFTVSLGVDGFHRRDSDTRLTELGDSVAGGLPIERELHFLGQRVSVVANDLPGAADIPNDPVLTVVGGNYFGEWNLDVKDLARVSFEPVYRLYEILGFDPAWIESICAEAFPPEARVPTEDLFTLVRSVNDGLNPDCGNVAVTLLHEHLPVLGGNNILAGDYFAFDTATSLGLPSVHHSRAVFHEYTSDRFDVVAKQTYWEGVARFADYFNIYGPLYSGTLRERLGLTGELDWDACREGIAAYLSAAAGADVDARVPRLVRLSREVLALDGRYATIASHIERNAEALVAECTAAYRAHADLLEDWPALVARARDVALRDFVQD